MRIAVIADIHGNLPALEAVLNDLARERPDRVVVAGDIVVGAPDSAACWARIRQLGYPMLRGNHERYVTDYGTPRAPPEWETEQFAPVRWAARQLGPVALAELAALPAMLRLPEVPGLLFVHGSPLSDSDSVFHDTQEAYLAERFGSVPERIVLRGHNHYAGVREWRGGRIVTVGSVGLPQNGNPQAQYTIIETDPQKAEGWSVAHRSIEYDVQATLRRFYETGYLAEAGAVAELYRREVATASMQIVPFLDFRASQIGISNLSLADALNRWDLKH
jgi:predicted phosphodiesterase